MIFRKVGYFIITLILFLGSRQLDAQDYYCIAVDSASGVISVTCHPADWTQVTQYEINYTDAAGIIKGSFLVIPTGPEDTYVIFGTNGKVARFFIDVIFHPATVSPYGHALSSIKVTVTQAAPGVAQLDWNPPDPPLAGTFYLERYEAPVWVTFDTISYSTPAASVTAYDTITAPFCTLSSVFYRVKFDEQPASGGCMSVSNVASGSFRDQTQPRPPAMDTVSIFQDPSGTLTGSAILGWDSSPSGDVVGYKIYRSVTNTGIFDSIGYVSTGVNQFIDVLSNPCLDRKEYYYAIVSTDGCGNGSTNISHAVSPHNLVLNVSNIDPCDRIANLSWNTYDNMPGALQGYIIYREVNFGDYVAIDTVSSSTNSYTDTYNFKNDSSYTYFVRAVNGSGLSSSSCRIRQIYKGPVAPDTLYVKQASVVSDSYVELQYYYGQANTVSRMLVERADSPGGTFQPIDTLTALVNSYLPQQYFINDTSAEVHQQSYFYRLSAIDSCNRTSIVSENTARSIFLTCQYTGNNSNKITWNEYSTWKEGVNRYEIYRSVNNVPNPSGMLTSVAGSETEYIDPIDTLEAGAEVCYFVKAIENSGNPFTSGAESVSNKECAVRDPFFAMPNAFRPDGANRYFRPVALYIDPAGFRMHIYNKWGQLIFETDNMLLGWDGMVKGGPAPCDVYTYHVSYKSLSGETFDKRGVVTLVR